MAARFIVGTIFFALVAQAQSLRDVSVAHPAPDGARIAIGFLGALEKWNDPHRSVRKLTLRLRQQGWQAESFSHRNLRTAKKAMVQALDRNRNHRIDPSEASSARVVIYGQSLGGGAAVNLAKFLRDRRVPVLLTVQVDSFGLQDGLIPENVRTAANFYQKQRFTLRGEDRIQAADPTRTRILGNFEYEYPLWKVYAWPESWPRRLFGGAHARMEADPVMWARVEKLIQEAGETK
jgi:pimeloyl-ACP methyl ester carboxylesterase